MLSTRKVLQRCKQVNFVMQGCLPIKTTWTQKSRTQVKKNQWIIVILNSINTIGLNLFHSTKQLASIFFSPFHQVSYLNFLVKLNEIHSYILNEKTLFNYIGTNSLITSTNKMRQKENKHFFPDKAKAIAIFEAWTKSANTKY